MLIKIIQENGVDIDGLIVQWSNEIEMEEKMEKMVNQIIQNLLIIKENKEREEKLNDILLGNSDMQNSAKNKKYKATVRQDVEQEKEFMSKRG